MNDQVKAPKTLGILSIVFGSIVGFFSIIGGIFILIFIRLMRTVDKMPPLKAKEIPVQDFIGAFADIYASIGYLNIAFLTFSLALLFIGIDQYKYRARAIVRTKIWSIAALLSLVGIVIYSATTIGPKYGQLMDIMTSIGRREYMPQGTGSLFSGFFSATFGITYLFFYSPYPIVMLVFFSKQKVKDSMVN
jgi:hypothetical protein